MTSKTWITSDLHFMHKNIIKYCPGSRGHLESIEEMNEMLVKNINSVVKEDDLLIIAGDICFAKPEVGVEFLKRLNGRKKFVWGNHDDKLRESSAYQSSKGLMGVEWDGDYLHFKHKFEDRNYQIIVTHFPFFSWREMHQGSIHLHGHTHQPFATRNTFGESKRCMDIGIDGNNLVPHNLDDLCSEMSRRDFRFVGHHDGSR